MAVGLLVRRSSEGERGARVLHRLIYENQIQCMRQGQRIRVLK